MPYLLLLFMVFCCSPVYASINKAEAINAIIGEAENQGYDGMLAIAESIRNRKSLRQVYGAKAERVLQKRYSQQTYNMAERAWNNSQYTHTIGQSSVWGNASDVEKFKKTKWFKQYRFVTKIKDHYFYRKV